MSHHRVKTKYLEMGPYGTTVEKTLYSHHNHGSDIVTFYNEEGNIILTIDDTQENNELDAINRLYQLDMKDDIQNVTAQELEELVKPRFGENPAKQLPEPFRSCFKAQTQPPCPDCKGIGGSDPYNTGWIPCERCDATGSLPIKDTES